MSRALFSVGGVTINTDYLLYIEPLCETEGQHRVIAMMSGAKEDRIVTLVSGLNSFALAKEIAEHLSCEINSEEDVYIESTTISQWTEDFLFENEDSYNTEENFFETDTVTLLGTIISKTAAAQTIIHEESSPVFFGNAKYHLLLNPIDSDCMITEPLVTCHSKGHAERCQDIYLKDLKNGEITFDRAYFMELLQR